MKTSSARTILSGSVIAIPGGCDTVLATSRAMLKPTPMNETTEPSALTSEPTPRNHSAAGLVGGEHAGRIAHQPAGGDRRKEIQEQ